MQDFLFTVIIFFFDLSVSKSAEIVPNTVTNEIAKFSTVSCNAPNLLELGIPAEQRCIDHNNLTRCWYTFIPDSVKNKDSTPLVFDLHGYGSCATWNPTYTGWERLAEEKEFVLILPQGNMDANKTAATCWSSGICCCFSKPMDKGFGSIVNIDDVDFLKQIVANTRKEVLVDLKRIYFAGHSNGCMMSQKMAALASDLVAAVCCHSGISLTKVSNNYQPTPIQIIMGNADNIVPYDTGNGFFPSAVGTAKYWKSVNGCKDNTTNVDRTNLYATHEFLNCTNGSNVQLLELFNVGHVPYLFGNNSQCFGLPCGTNVDTTSLAWNFCSSFQSTSEPNVGDAVPYINPDTFITNIDISSSFTNNYTSTSTVNNNNSTFIKNSDNSTIIVNNDTSSSFVNNNTSSIENTDTSSSFSFSPCSSVFYSFIALCISFSL